MQPDTYYHIYNRANGSENLFRSDENYRYFLQQWAKYINPIADSYAYCLMPNHFHFLIRTKNEEELSGLTGFRNLSGLVDNNKNLANSFSKQFSNLFNSYTKAFNKMYDRRGSLWSRPFNAKKITSDAYLTNVIFYIHHNPVHHGFTKNIENWLHSSYQALISEKQTQLQRKAVTNWFGGKQQLKRFHNQAIKELNKLEMEFT